jgi:hypothetical protein
LSLAIAVLALFPIATGAFSGFCGKQKPMIGGGKLLVFGARMHRSSKFFIFCFYLQRLVLGDFISKIKFGERPNKVWIS